MIKQIQDILANYMTAKGKHDREKAAIIDRWEKDFSASKIAEIRPEYEQNQLKAENELRESALALVEKELSKVDRWVAYMLDHISRESLSEIKTLEGVNLTPYQTQVLLQKYTGDFYATAAFCEMINRNRTETDRLTYTHPETFLQTAAQVKADAAFILANYAETAEKNIGQAAADIKIQLINNSWGKYIDAFCCEFFNEPDFDRPAPLTAAEKRTVDNIFSGCKDAYDKSMAAQNAAEKGYTEIILRSEYAKYLKGYTEDVKLSEDGKRLLYGADIPEQEEEQQTAAGVEMDLSYLTGMGAAEPLETLSGNAE